MSTHINEFAQPVGQPLPEWTARPLPGRVVLNGRFCRVEPLDLDRHADDLFAAYSLAADDADWTYVAAGPFESKATIGCMFRR